MQQQADEDELGLSSAALAALQEFAQENNLGLDGGEADLRLQVQEHFDVKARHHDFDFTFGEDDDDQQVSISLQGVNPELGQTLASTGLTVWRGAQELARFMWEHRLWFAGKSVLELGAGLGLCGVLASHLCRDGKVVITDGGEEFTDSAMDALRDNLEKNACDVCNSISSSASNKMRHQQQNKLEATGISPDQQRADVLLERLTWGEHEEFLTRHGGVSDGAGDSGGGVMEAAFGAGFDFIVAADVIYEEEAVTPLLRTVVDLLKLRLEADDQRRRHRQSCTSRPLPNEIRENEGGGEESEGYEKSADGARVTTAVFRDSNIREDNLASQKQDVGVSRPQELNSGASQGGAVEGVDEPEGAPERAPEESTFLLAFARRNVSIERVLREAEGLGLRWRIPSDFEPSSASENIYLMCLDR